MKAQRKRALSPRNPLASAVRFRRAGAHGPAGKALRRRAAMALRREIEALKEGP